MVHMIKSPPKPKREDILTYTLHVFSSNMYFFKSKPNMKVDVSKNGHLLNTAYNFT